MANTPEPIVWPPNRKLPEHEDDHLALPEISREVDLVKENIEVSHKPMLDKNYVDSSDMDIDEVAQWPHFGPMGYSDKIEANLCEAWAVESCTTAQVRSLVFDPHYYGVDSKITHTPN